MELFFCDPLLLTLSVCLSFPHSFSFAFGPQLLSLCEEEEEEEERLLGRLTNRRKRKEGRAAEGQTNTEPPDKKLSALLGSRLLTL